MQTKTIKLMALLSATMLCSLFVTPLSIRGQQSNPSPSPTATSTPQAPKNYEHFTHKTHLGQVNVPGTTQANSLSCASCHDSRDLAKDVVPTTEKNKQQRLKFPGHRACVECHVREFTSKPQQTCTICHETKQGLIARPPQRDFPRRYDFSTFFDAKQHEAHAKYKLPNGNETNCNFCHQQIGNQAALSVSSHPECYVCHSPNSTGPNVSKKYDCVVCHTEQRTDDLAVYGRPSKAFGALFKHNTHVGYVNGKCSECHAQSGGTYNQASPSLLKITAHASPDQRGGKGCFSCHDGGQHYGRAVFSGEPGSNGGGSCDKCHARPDGKVFPSSGLN